MKRRTILLTLVPALAVVVVSLVVGWRVAVRIPTSEDISAVGSMEEAENLHSEIRRLDPYLTICLVVANVAIFFAGAVVLYHVSTFPRVRKWRERVFDLSRPGERERLFMTGLLAVALVLAGLVLLRANAGNLSPGGDEIKVLATAIEARRQHGGAAGLAGALYGGRWSEREVHPLHVWLLVPLASRSIGFFVKARLVSTILAAAAVGAVFFVSWRLFGTAVAVLVVFLYGLNRSFIESSSRISPEGLLVLLVVLSVYFTLKGFEKPALLAAGGALAGLAYMTALSGLFLPAAFLLMACLTWGAAPLSSKHLFVVAGVAVLAVAAFFVGWWWLWLGAGLVLAALAGCWLGAFRKKGFYIYFVAFLVAASPLLVRNTIRYGNPLSDYKWSLALLDRAQQADTMEFAEGETDLRRYLDTHSAVDILKRFSDGVEMTLAAAANASSPLRRILYRPRNSPRRFRVRLWLGRFVLAVAALFVLFDTAAARRTFMAVLALVITCPVAWQISVSPGLQPILPLVPFVVGYFAVGMVRIFDRWQYRAVVLSAVCLIAFWSAANRLDAAYLFRAEKPPEDAVRLADWLAENLEPGQICLAGPDDDLRFGWYHPGGACMENVPNTPDVLSLVAASRKLGARYVIISRNLFSKRHLQFSGWVWVDRGNLSVNRPVRGWEVVFTDPVGRVDYIVFEVEKDDADEGR